ncbi:hypothetical protein GCM10009584_30660 [Ornithinimicrobium humiphilum]
MRRRRVLATGTAAVLLAAGATGTAALLGDRGQDPSTASRETAAETAPATQEPSPSASAETRTPRPVDAPRERIAGYTASEREPQPIPDGLRPYQDGVITELGTGDVDEEGVRVFVATWDGQTYDHPVAQAQYALKLMESYRLTGERAYLEMAEKNAQRIVDRRHEIDGAWYFPYDFEFDLHRNGRGVLTPPWASGMASGQALSTFVRLHEITGEQRWRDAADRTFAAFLQAPDGEGYFSSFVDDDGRLWLEEYSRYPVMTSERVLNGHMWSMYGIWDYWMMNGYDHADAESLWRGALHTLEQTAGRDFRNPGWASRYSIWQGQLAHTYHRYHQEQFLMIYRMSHDPVWAQHAQDYRSDFPVWRASEGTAVLTPRTTAAYRLDDKAAHISDRTMTVQETRELSLDAPVELAWDRRGKVPDGPNVIRLAEGDLKGWWVEEGYGRAWVKELVEEHVYAPDLQLSVEAEVEVAVYRYDEEGDEIDSRLVTLEPGVRHPSDRSAYTAGRPSYHLSGGELEGWWLPLQPEVRMWRDPAPGEG